MRTAVAACIEVCDVDGERVGKCVDDDGDAVVRRENGAGRGLEDVLNGGRQKDAHEWALEIKKQVTWIWASFR